MASNEKNAVAMKIYMKGLFNYFGIKTPDRRQIAKEFLQSIPRKILKQ